MTNPFFRDGQLPPSSIEGAALMGAMTQLVSPMSHVALEHMIAAAAHQFAAEPTSGEHYLAQLREVVELVQPREVFAGLAKSGMTYAPADLMDPQAWRGPDGSYDFGFQAACRAQMQDREALFETL